MPQAEADPDGWGDLIDRETLHWNISYDTASPPQVKQGRRLVYQYCCGPRARRRGQPCDPMLLILNADQQPHLAVSWAGVDSQREIAGFFRAFRQELAKLARLFG